MDSENVNACPASGSDSETPSEQELITNVSVEALSAFNTMVTEPGPTLPIMSDASSSTAQHHIQQQQLQQHLHQLQRQQQQLDARLMLDKDGLLLALRYFTSSTLTMRLAGIAQINNYIGLFNELVHTESGPQITRSADSEQFIEWILSNKIIEQLFGPNLHVELIKQSKLILTFVCNRLTSAQIDVIWSASQLKHCSRQVFDILMPLIKSMHVAAVLHLYSLLKNLDIREHSEQTLLLCSYILKYIWSKSLNVTNDPSSYSEAHATSSQLESLRKDPLFSLAAKSITVTPSSGRNLNTLGKEEEEDERSSSASLDASEEEIEEEEDDNDEDDDDDDEDDDEIREPPSPSEIAAMHISPSVSSLDSPNNSDEELDRFLKEQNCDEYSLYLQMRAKNSKRQFISQDEAATSGDRNFKTKPCKGLTVEELVSSDSDDETSRIRVANEKVIPFQRRMFAQQQKRKANEDLERKLLLKRKYTGKTFENLPIASSIVHNEDDNESDGEQQPLSKPIGSGSADIVTADAGLLPQISMLTDDHCSQRMINSDDEQLSDSNWSQMSQKNMADFDGEESTGMSGSEIEAIELEDVVRMLDPRTLTSTPSMAKKGLTAQHLFRVSNCVAGSSRTPLDVAANRLSSGFKTDLNTGCSSPPLSQQVTAELSRFSLDNVCTTGHTLLWDLLQDENIRLLNDGLAANCEKILFNLICLIADKRLRLKFIDGCLENLACNRSVIVCLRLLPKLLMSFEQYRGRAEIHAITLQADHERGMLRHFFANLLSYTKHRRVELQPELGLSLNESHSTGPHSPLIRKDDDTAITSHHNCPPTELYSHFEEIHTRLMFLSIVFSKNCSPDIFRLSKDQVDILWDCLANDLKCRDELFSWLLNQVQTRDQHALSANVLEYILTKKMPLLVPESFSMLALELLQNLCAFSIGRSPIASKRTDKRRAIKQRNLSPSSSSSSSNHSGDRSQSKPHNIITTPADTTGTTATTINTTPTISTEQKSTTGQRHAPRTLSTSSSASSSASTSSSSGSSSSGSSVSSSASCSAATLTDYCDPTAVSIRQLWDIALRALNTDVSMAAIRHLNNYYIHLQQPSCLDREEEFLQRCLDYLHSSSKGLEDDQDPQPHLTVIQRALILLKTHLEAFRCKYSFQMRLLQLVGENETASHCSRFFSSRTGGPTLRIVCQPASLSEKVTMEMQLTDYVGELRAEVHHWWNGFLQKLKVKPNDSLHTEAGSSKSIVPNPSSDAPLRLISQGHEITFEMDEKTFAELNFKDGQVVYISTGSRMFKRKEEHDTRNMSLPKNRIPTAMLLESGRFNQLFMLLQQLGSMQAPFLFSGRAQQLSRRVWEIINLLPTSPSLWKRFKYFTKEDLAELLNPASPQKLLYSLQIVDLLQRHSQRDLRQVSQRDWVRRFVQSGGLLRLFDILSSGALCPSSSATAEGTWDEWKQDCLASLLQLLYELGVHSALPAPGNDSTSPDLNMSSSSESGSKLSMDSSIGGGRRKRLRKCSADNLNISLFNHHLLQLLDEKQVSALNILLDILHECVIGATLTSTMQTGSCGRAQIVHHALHLLTSWLYSQPSIRTLLFEQPQLGALLQGLILDDLDHSVRREACTSLYRLCLGQASSIRQNGLLFIPMLLNQLLRFLAAAQQPRLHLERTHSLFITEIQALDKEPIGFGCKDYFWLVCRLLDSLDNSLVDCESQTVNVDQLCFELAIAIEAQLNHLSTLVNQQQSFSNASKDLIGLLHELRPKTSLTKSIRSKHHSTRMTSPNSSSVGQMTNEDSGYLNVIQEEPLRGLMCVMTVALKHNQSFKQSSKSGQLLFNLFRAMFCNSNHSNEQRNRTAQHSNDLFCRSCCTQPSTRSAAFDLMVEIIKNEESNHLQIMKLLYTQHVAESHTPYPWDYWPHDDRRSDCGYVGLINLGATCYMAASVQHLFMFPEVRKCVLNVQVTDETKHSLILQELQRMFVFLSQSERKAYNPKPFCKVYTMDNQPLNTGEQKDMTEFFTDLISKLEEMSGDLKETLRGLFAGQLSNNVVSLDCDHISRTNEEFYTLRCKVADMRNLYDSLDELTVKDTLEGDNMYTCSQCGKKVRAEKRACLKRLPKILCFNTLRYTFNMVTMTKEKVNTHFSFPMRIDLSPYLEQNLIRNEANEGKEVDCGEQDFGQEPRSTGFQMEADSDDVSNEYELIGVTVHTGTADGGHYYCFIREPDARRGKDKWYIFNDAEVHLFDAAQLASECFGGEVTSKTYDSINDKFMDFPIEKTNSAYMLFYERLPGRSGATSCSQDTRSAKEEPKSDLDSASSVTNSLPCISWIDQMPVSLRHWILNDNYQFNRDKSIFEHSYFHFMWQVCAYIPQTTNCSLPIHLHSTQLATAFVVETLIHSKEKPTIANWIELLTKQFNANSDACEWLIDHISHHYFQWPVQILFRCPNQMVRQLFQRLCIHVITQLRPTQRHLYLLPSQDTTEQNVAARRNTLNSIRTYCDGSHTSIASVSSTPTTSLDTRTNTSLNDSIDRSTDSFKQTSHQTKDLSQLNTVSSISWNDLGSSSTNLINRSQIESIEMQMPDFGSNSCVSRFVRRFLLLIKCNHFVVVKSHLKHLTEYFNLLYEFAKMGDIEVEFLLKIDAISIIINFYMNSCKPNGEFGDLLSEEDEDDCIETVEEETLRDSTKDIVSGFSLNSSFIGPRTAPLIGQFGPGLRDFTSDKYMNKPVALEKLLSLVAYLVENSRCSETRQLQMSAADHESLTGRNFAFLQRQIRENINLRQSFNLICTLSRHNDRLAGLIVSMILQSIHKQPDISQPFFVILSMLVELCNGEQSSGSGMPLFSATIYPKIWEIAEQNPLHCLEWLTSQVPRNQSIHQIVLQNLDNWSEYFLIGHANQRVRNAAAVLIISLVPNNLFRQSYYKSPKTLLLQTNREQIELGAESLTIVRKIFQSLLSLLKRAKTYVDIHLHGTNKLTSYFALMYYCLVSPKEKLMLVPYFDDLWNLFQPKLSEPAVPINQNKQTLLCFWYHACVDCPENVQCILQNPSATKNIAYNYILADHDDQDVIIFNRLMLPSYYGLLRLCCAQSRSFTRQLALHQNLIWAFKNITPYLTQYQSAVNELFKLMRLFIEVHSDSSEQELQEIDQFKRSTIMLYLNSVDPRSCWTTLIAAFTILFENEQDQVFAISNGAIPALFLSFNTLFMMFHEATACHITSEIVDVLRLLCSLLSTLHENRHQTELKEQIGKWKEHTELVRKPIHLLNTYTPAEVRAACFDVLIELIRLFPKECIPIAVQTLGLGHLSFQDQFSNFTAGPFFPRLGQRNVLSKSSLRPSCPVFQMHFHPKMMEIGFGKDEAYDKAVRDYFFPYYTFIVNMCRIAIANNNVNQELVGFCSMVALESLPMHGSVFPHFWLSCLDNPDGLYFINLLCSSCNFFKDYIYQLITQEREFLMDNQLFDFIRTCLPKLNGFKINQNFITKTLTFLDYLKDESKKESLSPDLYYLQGDFRGLILLMHIDQDIRNAVSAEQPLFECLIKKIQTEFEATQSDIPSKKQKSDVDPDSNDDQVNVSDQSAEDEPSTSTTKEKRVRILANNFQASVNELLDFLHSKNSTKSD